MDDSDLEHPDRRAAVLRAGVRWSRAVAVGAVVASAVGAALPLGPGPWGVVVAAVAGAGLLLGLPHGALDHVLAARVTGWPPLTAAAAYAAVAAVTWVLLETTGPVALAAVLALSVLHFALGELEVLRGTTDWRPGTAVAVAVGVAGTGALLLPLARAGDQLVEVAAAVSPDLGPVVADAGVRAGLAAVWGAAALVAVLAALRARQREVVLDVVLVGALGLVVPPLAAFALWFGGWHGLRHCARLLVIDRRCAAWVDAGRSGRAVRALAGRAAWPSLAATAVLVALLALTATAADPTQALGGTLVLLLALTVPHMLVVLWVDRTAWRRPEPASASVVWTARDPQGW